VVDFDLTVVGAGILGISHALAARERGFRVLLLERDALPAEASVRNFGLLIPTALVEPWRGLGVRSLSVYRRLARDTGLELNRSGTLYLAHQPSDLEQLQLLVERWSVSELPIELLSVAQTTDLHPLLCPDSVCGSLFSRDELRLEPRIWLPALLKYLQASDDVVFRSSTQVAEVLDESTHCVVRTTSGDIIRSRAAVVCSGSDLQTLFPQTLQSAGLRYCKLQMVRTSPAHTHGPLPSVASPLCLRSYPAFQSLGLQAGVISEELQAAGIHVWMAFDNQGRIVLGDSHQYSDARPNDLLSGQIESLFIDYANSMLKSPVESIESRWCGVYMQPPDGQMLLVDLSNRVRVRTGLGGKGMTVSPALAEDSIAELCDRGVF